MKKGSLGIALALAIPLMATATTTNHNTSSTRPPTHLKLVGDHWTPWDPPTPPEGAQVYLIVKGDTLWDLAQRDLEDPFLWPSIWDQNRYILDSHWIYPGDPLLMPGPVTVVAEEVQPPDIEGEASSDEPGAGEAMDVPEVAMVPPAGNSGRPTRSRWRKADPDSAADHTDMLCSGYILPEHWESDLFVYAGEEEHKMGYSPGDVVYINQGRSSGVEPGDRFFAVHQERRVNHPVTGKRLGYHVRRMAVLQVLVAQAETATAEVVDGCAPVQTGYDLVPYEDLVSPPRRDTDLERYGVENNGRASGHVVFTELTRTAIGAGDIAHVNLGSSDGVQVGDYLMIYRDNFTDEKPNEAGFPRIRRTERSTIAALNSRKIPRHKEIPRKMLGEMVVLASTENTATVKIMTSFREIYLGDQVQLMD